VKKSNFCTWEKQKIASFHLRGRPGPAGRDGRRMESHVSRSSWILCIARRSVSACERKNDCFVKNTGYLRGFFVVFYLLHELDSGIFAASRAQNLRRETTRNQWHALHARIGLHTRENRSHLFAVTSVFRVLECIPPFRAAESVAWIARLGANSWNATALLLAVDLVAYLVEVQPHALDFAWKGNVKF
jgi:hypothetical protein